MATIVVASAAMAVGNITLAASSGEPATINQCRNGAFDAHIQCSGSAFQNGNLGATNSHYREGDFVPFQAMLTGLTVGPHTLDIQWDETASSKHAYDYIGSYKKTETNADACAGVLTASQCAVHTTAPVIADPVLASPCSFTSTYGATQVAGSVDIYGASGTSTMSYFDAPSSCQGSALKQSAHVNFMTAAGQTSVVVAWGGHVASQLDWGLGNSASQISGSPYHMRLLALDTIGLGNQDRSIKAAAILPVPTITTSADGASGTVPQVSGGTSFSDVATLTGDTSHGDVTGFVDFYMCGPTTSATACAVGTQVGGDVSLAVQATTPPSSKATSATVSPVATGFYCFRVLYTPDATAGYSPGQSTSTTNECVEVISRSTSTTSTPQTSATETGTFANATTAALGGWIRDSAVVSDTTTPTGTIAFHVCGPTASATACTTGGTSVAENTTAKTSDTSSVTFYSAAIQPDTAGYYCFRAEFTGSGAFTNSSDSSTGECIHVLPASPGTSTTPSGTTTFSATLDDSASIGPGNNPTGTVTFRLYNTLAHCSAGGTTIGAGGLLYEKVITLSTTAAATKVAATTDTGSLTTDSTNVVTTPGDYEWIALYSGDTNNDASNSTCGDETLRVGASSVLVNP